MWTRRRLVASALAGAGIGALRAAHARAGGLPDAGHEHHSSEGTGSAASAPTAPSAPTDGDTPRGAYRPVVVPNGSTLPWTVKDGAKEFRLVAEPVEREFAPGMKVKCWGYNGQTPGPTIEAVEGDRVRIFVTNRLPEHTSVHWHGILLPNGMDGVSGLNQPPIRPGEIFVYEFTLRQNGTQMYHPHADEMLQMAVGMMGLFVIHPREPREPAVDRDFAIMLHEWAVHPGTYRPDPAIMTDFNMFTFNSRVFPGTDPLVVRTGERVRLRFGNLSMDSHPIHLHGFQFKITGTDGGAIDPSAQWPETTVNVPVGTTRDVEFVADAPGDWILHCHKSHHTMNAMAHDVPNTLGASQREVEQRIRALLPGYMPMGESGMAEMQDMARHMRGPRNTLPMMGGVGPFGNIEMGGMFTIVKVRDDITTYEDPGWYDYPPGTVAWRVDP
jgi:manganese oxidase